MKTAPRIAHLNALVALLQQRGWRLVEEPGAQTWYDATPATRLVRIVEAAGAVMLDGPGGMYIVDPGDARIGAHIEGG